MKKESNLAKKIIAYLNDSPGTRAVKMHGSVHMEAGLPDIFCVSRGRPFLFELKIGDEKPSEIQKVQHRRWREAGATVEVVYSLSDVQIILGTDVHRPAPYVIGKTDI